MWPLGFPQSYDSGYQCEPLPGHPSISVRTPQQSECQSNAGPDWHSPKCQYRHLGSGWHFATEVLDPVLNFYLSLQTLQVLLYVFLKNLTT